MKLKDIAEEVGVSISTVSRILSGKNVHAANPELREEILRIAKEGGYVQNSAAQCLQRGEKFEAPPAAPKVLACVFARTPLKDSFFMQLSHSVTEYFIQQNCIVKYTLALQDLPWETILEIFSHLDGVVILGRCEEEFVDQLHSIVKNVIYVGLNQTTLKYDQVVCDGFQAGITAVDQLYQLGHRKIAYIGEVHNEIRYQAYQHYMESTQSLAIDPLRVVDVILSMKGGYEGLKTLMKQAPDTTGVFCANDTTAMGALRACQDLGLNVPRDISIIGVDDLETSKYLSPMLSTVHIPILDMGKMAAKILLDRIEKGHTTPVSIAFPSQFILRESCVDPRQKI